MSVAGTFPKNTDPYPGNVVSGNNRYIWIDVELVQRHSLSQRGFTNGICLAFRTNLPMFDLVPSLWWVRALSQKDTLAPRQRNTVTGPTRTRIVCTVGYDF